MKPLKLSKTSLLILLVGIIIVVVAGLGLTRSQQLQAQDQLDEELSIAEMRLNKLQETQLRQQQEELQKQLDESTIQLAAAKDKLRQSVESIDVTDEFFLVASQCGVKVMSISLSTVSTSKLNNIDCLTINLNATVEGEVSNIVYFIISLNADYTMGYVKSTQIAIPKACSDDIPTANIQMVIYSYEGD